ncbi:hypothetical protein BT69DRAFT_787105 [Atractiella rhizophila]|nr:hypothetical protein BT69DRAFT_787105 [Atractiella rhizophila]
MEFIQVAAHLEQGQRLENLSWRLWHLHSTLVANGQLNSSKGKREFKKLSKSTGEKASRAFMNLIKQYCPTSVVLSFSGLERSTRASDPLEGAIPSLSPNALISLRPGQGDSAVDPCGFQRLFTTVSLITSLSA